MWGRGQPCRVSVLLPLLVLWIRLKSSNVKKAALHTEPSPEVLCNLYFIASVTCKKRYPKDRKYQMLFFLQSIKYFCDLKPIWNQVLKLVSNFDQMQYTRKVEFLGLQPPSSQKADYEKLGLSVIFFKKWNIWLSLGYKIRLTDPKTCFILNLKLHSPFNIFMPIPIYTM